MKRNLHAIALAATVSVLHCSGAPPVQCADVPSSLCDPVVCPLPMAECPECPERGIEPCKSSEKTQPRATRAARPSKKAIPLDTNDPMPPDLDRVLAPDWSE